MTESAVATLATTAADFMNILWGGRCETDLGYFPHKLSSLPPKNGKQNEPKVKFFNNRASVIKFITEHHEEGHWNFYCPVGIIEEKCFRARMSETSEKIIRPRKANSKEIVGSYFAWLDIDYKEERLGSSLYTWKNWIHRVYKIVVNFQLPPNMILASGTGLWFFWRLKEMLYEEEGLRELNDRLSAKFRHLGGDSSVKNIDRICRLPGLPSYKQTMGRNEWKTSYHWHHDNYYDWEYLYHSFPPRTTPKKAQGSDLSFSNLTTNERADIIVGKIQRGEEFMRYGVNWAQGNRNNQLYKAGKHMQRHGVPQYIAEQWLRDKAKDLKKDDKPGEDITVQVESIIRSVWK